MSEDNFRYFDITLGINPAGYAVFVKIACEKNVLLLGYFGLWTFPFCAAGYEVQNRFCVRRHTHLSGHI
jgi:hypothetical protein